MGRLCSWCGSFLSLATVNQMPVSHVLCSGCLEDLQVGLTGEGLRLRGSEDEANSA